MRYFFSITKKQNPVVEPDTCNQLLEKLLDLRGSVFLGYSLLIKQEKKKVKYIINLLK